MMIEFSAAGWHRSGACLLGVDGPGTGGPPGEARMLCEVLLSPPVNGRPSIIGRLTGFLDAGP